VQSRVWSVSDPDTQHWISIVGPFSWIEAQEASYNDGLIANLGDLPRRYDVRSSPSTLATRQHV